MTRMMMTMTMARESDRCRQRRTLHWPQQAAAAPMAQTLRSQTQLVQLGRCQCQC